MSKDTVPVDQTAIGIKLGIELLMRTAPSGIAWVRQWLRGKKIVIVGQPRAGKTSLVRFMQYGIFAEPGKHMPRTRRNRKTAAFTVAMGRDQALKLEVGTAVDTVGQVAASEHVNIVKRFKPHALIVILDLTAKWKGDNEYAAEFYLEDFSDFLSHQLSRNKSLRKSLTSIIVVLNKADEAKTGQIRKWRRGSRKILRDSLMLSFGPKAKEIPIMPCSLLEAYDAENSPDKVIKTLAISLSE